MSIPARDNKTVPISPRHKILLAYIHGRLSKTKVMAAGVVCITITAAVESGKGVSVVHLLLTHRYAPF